MALNLYRRHRRDCKAAHPEEFRSGEFDERKKGWKRCSCPIFASGTLQGKFKRQTTGQWEWTPAKAVVAELEKAGSWGGQVMIPEPLPEFTKPHRATVAHAVKAFLAELQETAAFATHKKYRLLLTKMVEFSEKRGYKAPASHLSVVETRFLIATDSLFDYRIARQHGAPCRRSDRSNGRRCSLRLRSSPTLYP